MLIYSIGVRREREENKRYCAVIGNDSMLVNKKSKSFGTTKKKGSAAKRNAIVDVNKY